MTKREYGKPLQPSTWDTNLKTLFAKFNEEGIQFKHLKHFNKDGEFHAVLMKQWQEAMQDDPTFASGVGTSTIDYMRQTERFGRNTISMFFLDYVFSFVHCLL